MKPQTPFGNPRATLQALFDWLPLTALGGGEAVSRERPACVVEHGSAASPVAAVQERADGETDCCVTA